MSQEFVKQLLLLVGIAVAVGLVIAAMVYAGGSSRAKRYRPGRPFGFRPVWFLSAPQRQARAGIVAGRELVAPPGGASPGVASQGVASPGVAGRVARPRETGGASDRW